MICVTMHFLIVSILISTFIVVTKAFALKLVWCCLAKVNPSLTQLVNQMVNLLISYSYVDALVQKRLLITSAYIPFDALFTIGATSPLAYLRYGNPRVISGLVNIAVKT